LTVKRLPSRHTSGGTAPACLAALLVALALGGPAACDVDDEQVRLCQRLIAAFEDAPEAVTIERVAAHPIGTNGIILDYRLVGEAPDGSPLPSGAGGDAAPVHWISCRFETDRTALFARESRLVEVSTDRTGRLSDVDLQMLKIWLRLGPGRNDGVKPVSRTRPSEAQHPAAPCPTALVHSAASRLPR
jgi:hypothetical protein